MKGYKMLQVIIALGGAYLFNKIFDEVGTDEHVSKNNAGDGGVGTGDKPSATNKPVHRRRVNAKGKNGSDKINSNDGVGSDDNSGGGEQDSATGVHQPEQLKDSDNAEQETGKKEKDTAPE